MSIRVGRDRLCLGICAALTPVSTGHILVIHRHKIGALVSIFLKFTFKMVKNLTPT